MKAKRGRPPLNPSKTKAAYLEVRLTVAEKQAFNEAAEVAGLALSAWVRERLRGAAREELGKVTGPSRSLNTIRERRSSKPVDVPESASLPPLQVALE